MALKFLRAVWTRKSFVLHLTVIATLIIISIWDSALIIRTFVSDNRITVVHTRNGKDTPTYFENITFEVYGMDSILPKNWSDELNITEFSTYNMYYEEIVEIAATGELELSTTNINTTEGKVFTAALIAYLSSVDKRCIIYCLFVGQNACAKIVAEYRNLSRVLRNGRELGMLRDSLFSELRDALAFDFGPSRASVAIHNIALHGLRFEINAAELLHNASMFSGNLRLYNTLSFNGTRFNGGLNINVLAGRSRVTLELDQKSYTKIVIDVKNIGIFDKSRATQWCTRDPEIQLPLSAIGDRPDCCHRSYLLAVVKKCGCVPFVAEKSYHKLESAEAHLPFCDLQHYSECDGLLKTDTDEDWLPSCVTIRNQYTISNMRLGHCGEEDDRCANVLLELRSSDRTFVMYEDRNQLTIPQFLSQLGGDIGLYTGLSLLSLWQLILFIYARYKRYQPRTSAKGIEFLLQFLIEQVKTARPFVIHDHDLDRDQCMAGDRSKSSEKIADDRDSMDPQRKEIEFVLHQQPISYNDANIPCKTVRELFERIDRLSQSVDEIRRSALAHDHKFDELFSMVKNQPITKFDDSMSE